MRKNIETSKHCERQSSTLGYFVIIIVIFSNSMHICFKVQKRALNSEAIFFTELSHEVTLALCDWTLKT